MYATRPTGKELPLPYCIVRRWVVVDAAIDAGLQDPPAQRGHLQRECGFFPIFDSPLVFSVLYLPYFPILHSPRAPCCCRRGPDGDTCPAAACPIARRWIVWRNGDAVAIQHAAAGSRAHQNRTPLAPNPESKTSSLPGRLSDVWHRGPRAASQIKEGFPADRSPATFCSL